MRMSVSQSDVSSCRGEAESCLLPLDWGVVD